MVLFIIHSDGANIHGCERVKIAWQRFQGWAFQYLKIYYPMELKFAKHLSFSYMYLSVYSSGYLYEFKTVFSVLYKQTHTNTNLETWRKTVTPNTFLLGDGCY